MLSRSLFAGMRRSLSSPTNTFRLQSTTASGIKTKRPCGKCVRCSCHTNTAPATPTVAARHQSTAPALAGVRQGSFEPCEGRPAWIKDPTAPTGLNVSHVVTNESKDKRCIEVVWEDDSRSFHPYLWLRDNCTCPDCFHPTTLSRRFLMKNLDTDIEPRNIQVDQAERKIYITWSDGHGGVYPFSWLEGRNFTEKSRQQRDKWMPRKNIYWGQEMQDKIPTETFENLMTDDRALYRWITTLEEVGLFRVKDAPQEEGVLTHLAKRVAFLKPTHFNDLWEVRTRDNPSNLQYTTATLGLHIDLTYYDYTPGVQLLHCIKQAKVEGGDNQFVDGFHIAERMREEQPEHFRLLTEVAMDHYDLGEEADNTKFFKLQRQPVIRFDREGRFDRITYNNMVRDNVLCVPLEQVNPLYEAMKAFDTMLHDPKSHIVYKMAPGDIICFHNYRVMHGRKGYRQVEPGDRHLQGAFLDWDEMYCKRRVLQMMLNVD